VAPVGALDLAVAAEADRGLELVQAEAPVQEPVRARVPELLRARVPEQLRDEALALVVVHLEEAGVEAAGLQHWARRTKPVREAKKTS
jgi:hypothetical protein